MPDWNAIKSEYITEDISYRKLADKWGVSFRTLADHARKESWNKERSTHRDNVTKQTVQKIAARQSSDCAYKLLRLQEAADSMLNPIAPRVSSTNPTPEYNPLDLWNDNKKDEYTFYRI